GGAPWGLNAAPLAGCGSIRIGYNAKRARGRSSTTRSPPMLRDLHHSQRTPRRPSFRPRVEPLETRDTPSTTVLTVSPNPATVGQAVTLTATVTDSGADNLQPGTGQTVAGLVTFFDGPTSLGKVNVSPTAGTSNQGTAHLTTSGLVAG